MVQIRKSMDDQPIPHGNGDSFHPDFPLTGNRSHYQGWHGASANCLAV